MNIAGVVIFVIIAAVSVLIAAANFRPEDM
jgi:hypothetical protein